jgi:6-phosphogluconate dehydrogenase
MTQIKLDKSLAEDLITSKLRILKQYIDEILARWNESSSKDFLEKARKGIYKNAEDDAVELHQLLLDYTKYQEILKLVG